MKTGIYIFLVVAALLVSCVEKVVEKESAEAQGRHAELIHDSASAGRMQLQSPLTSVYESPQDFDVSASAIELCIELTQPVRSWTGCGVYLSDDEGNWLCSSSMRGLQQGVQTLRFNIDHSTVWNSTISGDTLNAYKKQLVDSFGCFMWSDGVPGASSRSSSNADVLIHACRLIMGKVQKGMDVFADAGIYDLHIDDFDHGQGSVQLSTGKRWQLQFKPDPFPDFPYNSRHFRADLILESDADEGTHLRIPAFYNEPMQLQNRGSMEEAVLAEAGFFCVRFRARHAAHYHCHLELSWQGTAVQTFMMPDVVVSGDDWDNYVRTDADDNRFLSINGEFFWPTGMNLKSPNDDWGKTYLHTRTTPSLGTMTYDAYLERLGRSGGRITEIWMSNWNLCLEWYDGWESYHGLNGYSAKHAQQLDDILDCALKNNIRVILSFRNHGQAHTRSGNRHIPSDTNEWKNNPYSKHAGGFLSNAVEIFTDERALQRQEDVHRYICARYADHPAICMWKLWSEVDLTDAAKDDSHKKFKPTQALETWHRRMSTHISDLDIYDHLLTTHFSTDFHRVDMTLFKIKEITVVCINAYLWRLHGAYGRSYTLVQLLHDSVYKRGAFRIHADILGELHKPIMVTEFGGGNPYHMTEAQLLSHHLSAPWAAMVSGHAIAPLFWWYEWVDQNNYWHPMQSVAAFLKGEDLRGAQSRSVQLQADHQKYALWSHAWARPGCILGYVIEKAWAEDGRRHPLIEGMSISISSQAAAGALLVEWWDASLGTIISRKRIQHLGGILEIQAPAFRRHIAYKLKCLSDEQ